MTTSETALELYDRGWRPIDLPARRKAPVRTGVTGYRGINPSRDEVERIIDGSNIALRMGVDVIGLDVDAHDGKPGLDTLARLRGECGNLPPTVLSHSNRGDKSCIRFFRVPNGTRLVTALPGIELIQWFHRYAVVAPSIHPEGRDYAWWDEQDGSPIDLPPEVGEIPALPWKWIERLAEDASGDPAMRLSPTEISAWFDEHGDIATPDAIERLARVTGYMNKRIAKGIGRHETLRSGMAMAMLEVAAGLYPANEAERVLEDWWRPVHAAMSHDRRDPGEFDRLMVWAIGYAQANPTQVAEKKQEAHVMPVDDTDGPPTLLLVDWHQRDEDDTEPLVDGFLMPGRWTQLTAKKKEGKSTVALWVAVELAEGRDPWTGRPRPPVTVLYVDAENGEDDIEEKLSDMGHHDPAEITRLHIGVDPVRLDTNEGAEVLTNTVTQLEPDLVVLDGINGHVLGDENDQETWLNMYRLAVHSLKRRRIAVLSSDNLGKDVTKGARGSSVKGDKADAGYRVMRRQDGAILKREFRRSRVYDDEIVLAVHVVDGAVVSMRRSGGQRPEPEGTNEVVEFLDRLGVPVDIGRPTVRRVYGQQIEEAGGFRNTALGAAITRRRRRVQQLTMEPVDNTCPEVGDSPGTGVRGQVNGSINETPADLGGDSFADSGTAPGDTTAPPISGAGARADEQGPFD